MGWPHVVSGDVGGGPLLFRIFHPSLMFYCSTKVWFVPCGPQFTWRLSEINGIALYWLYIKASIFLRHRRGGQHIGHISSPLYPFNFSGWKSQIEQAKRDSEQILGPTARWELVCKTKLLTRFSGYSLSKIFPPFAPQLGLAPRSSLLSPRQVWSIFLRPSPGTNSSISIFLIRTDEVRKF